MEPAAPIPAAIADALVTLVNPVAVGHPVARALDEIEIDGNDVRVRSRAL